jgi:hypothetical protein
MKTLLLATSIIALTATSAFAQAPFKPKPFAQFGTSSCTAQGSPPCSISCPAGKTAICNNGGLIPGQCLCR